MRHVILFLICMFACSLQAQSINEEALSLLNLNYPGLEKVKELYEQGKKEAAAQALLKYYRNRTGVVNPAIDLNNITINKREQQWADEALEHTFYVHDGYQPAFNYGKDINWKYWPVKDNELRWQPPWVKPIVFRVMRNTPRNGLSNTSTGLRKTR